MLLLSPLALWKASANQRLDLLPLLRLRLLCALAWALAACVPTGRVITLEGSSAVLPGAPGGAGRRWCRCWTTARSWRRSTPPPAWCSNVGRASAALVGADGRVPVLTLRRHLCAGAAVPAGDMFWAFAGLALAFALSASALAARQGRHGPGCGRARAGPRRAGAGCAMVLQEQWLTLAVSLFLPAAGLDQARAELPPLRRVALAVGGLLLIRLLLNLVRWITAYGTTPVAILLATYGVPAGRFRDRRPHVSAAGPTTSPWRAGGRRHWSFFTVLCALEIRHAPVPELTADATSWRRPCMSAAMGLQGLAAMLLARAARPSGAGLACASRVGWRWPGSAGLLVFQPACSPTWTAATPR